MCRRGDTCPPSLQVHIHPDLGPRRTAPRSDAWSAAATRRQGVSPGGLPCPLRDLREPGGRGGPAGQAQRRWVGAHQTVVQQGPHPAGDGAEEGCGAVRQAGRCGEAPAEAAPQAWGLLADAPWAPLVPALPP